MRIDLVGRRGMKGWDGGIIEGWRGGGVEGVEGGRREEGRWEVLACG